MSDLPVLMRAGGPQDPLLPSYITVAEFKVFVHSMPADVRNIVLGVNGQGGMSDEEIMFWLTATRYYMDALPYKGIQTDPFPGFVDESGQAVQSPGTVLIPAWPRMNVVIGGQAIDSMTVPGAIQYGHATYTGWGIVNPDNLGSQDHPSTMTTAHIEAIRAGTFSAQFKDTTEVTTWHQLEVRHSQTLNIVAPYLLNPDIINPPDPNQIGPSTASRTFAPGSGNRVYGIRGGY